MTQPWQPHPEGGYGRQPKAPPQQPPAPPRQPPQQQPPPPQQPPAAQQAPAQQAPPPQPGYGFPPAPAQGGFGPPPQQPPGGFGPPPSQGGPGPHPPGPMMPPPPYGAAPPGPYGQPQSPGGFPPPAPGSGPPQNVFLAIGVALLCAVLAAFLYGVLLHALFDESKEEFRVVGYAGALVGVLVGLGPAFFAKRNWAVYILGAVLSLAAVWLGELYGMAMVYSDHYTAGVLTTHEIFFQDFAELVDIWREISGPENYVWLFLAPAVALGFCRSVARKAQV
ncbi:hypothetical protein PJ985_07355 [Streptomyces sp. ACA25]|uniref:hypothetical protein n=1 Tax=Streptomyces sp. ACA25 TaxID=3022596 RepID=UPI002307E167|nr:hypothetical protein [Streptomyces sp. ACA25]MDB1087379.1 hypothetical protein [Streptomyces sp. ACA25]